MRATHPMAPEDERKDRGSLTADRKRPRLAAQTFRGRLARTMTLLSVAILAAASAATYLRVRQTLFSHLDSTLLSIARTEVASALDGPGGRAHLHESPMILNVPEGVGYDKLGLIKDAARTIRARTSNLRTGPPLETDEELEATARNGVPCFGSLRREGETLRGVYYPLRDISGAPLVAIVAISTQPLERSLDSLLRALAITLCLGGIAAWLVANRLSRRLTRPLEHIADAARSIGDANLTARIPDVSPDAELSSVTKVLNDMLLRLEEAFATQRGFITDASHELRTPVANLRGTVEVALRHERDADAYREALQVALSESERLSRLVEDLLILSRSQARQLSLEARPCDLADIARDAMTAIDGLAHKKNVRLRMDIDPAPVSGDPHRLRQTLDNLLGNALRYAPNGSEITLRTHADGGYAYVSVQDQGPGLSPEEQRRVFDRFYRTDAARARDTGGLGLGLAISKAIVEAHRGTISVHGRLGEGCRFEIALPVLNPDASPFPSGQISLPRQS